MQKTALCEGYPLPVIAVSGRYTGNIEVKYNGNNLVLNGLNLPPLHMHKK